MFPKVDDYIELIEMKNDPNPLDVGDKGVVKRVTPFGDGTYQIEVDWESGRRLHLIYPEDKIKILKSEE